MFVIFSYLSPKLVWLNAGKNMNAKNIFRLWLVYLPQSVYSYKEEKSEVF